MNFEIVANLNSCRNIIFFNLKTFNNIIYFVQSKTILNRIFFQECDLHRSIYECQAFAFSTRTTFDNCLLSNTYGRSLDTLLETSYGWEVWTYGGLIFPDTNNGGPISSSLQKQDYFSVSGRECLGGRIMDTKARYWYCKTGTHYFLICIWVMEF